MQLCKLALAATLMLFPVVAFGQQGGCNGAPGGQCSPAPGVPNPQPPSGTPPYNPPPPSPPPNTTVPPSGSAPPPAQQPGIHIPAAPVVEQQQPQQVVIAPSAPTTFNPAASYNAGYAIGSGIRAVIQRHKKSKPSAYRGGGEAPVGPVESAAQTAADKAAASAAPKN